MHKEHHGEAHTRNANRLFLGWLEDSRRSVRKRASATSSEGGIPGGLRTVGKLSLDRFKLNAQV